MSDPWLSSQRRALIDQEAALRREIQDLGADPTADEVAFETDAGFSDRSHSTEERGRVIATARALRANLREVERALERIDDGHLRHLRAVRQADRARAPRGDSVGAPVHRLQEAGRLRCRCRAHRWSRASACSSATRGESATRPMRRSTATSARTPWRTPRRPSAASARPRSRRSASGLLTPIDGVAPRADAGDGARTRDGGLGRQGHHHRALGDDG